MSALEKLRPNSRTRFACQVRELLGRTEAFAQMDRGKQRDFANKLVDVVAYLANPETATPATAQSAIDAEGLAGEEEREDGVEKLQDRLAGKQQFAGKEFGDGAMKAGTQAFRDLVQAVDFPKFVSGLIEGVFTSIVNSSIRQMQAYKSCSRASSRASSSSPARSHAPTRRATTCAIAFPIPSMCRPPAAQPASSPGIPRRTMRRRGSRKSSTSTAPSNLDEESEAVLLQRAKVEMARSKQQTARHDGAPRHQSDRRHRRPDQREGRLRREGQRYRDAAWRQRRCTTRRPRSSSSATAAAGSAATTTTRRRRTRPSSARRSTTPANRRRS